MHTSIFIDIAPFIFDKHVDAPGSRSGSQHGSRENSMARNTYSSSSRSLHQPSHFNTLPMSAASQKGLRVDNKVRMTHCIYKTRSSMFK